MKKTINKLDLKPVSKILVIGGGIAGIQASLDLANSGFKVYLLDKKPSIGGVMAQLDKTFPTNDCSMCILSPKLVDAGRNPNIELLTYCNIESIKGNAGNFKVTILKNARYVDIEKCKSCGDCSDVCPVLIPNTFDENLSYNHAIYQLFPQSNPSAFVIQKQGVSPCKATCPIHVNAQGYIALISVGKYKEALNLIMEKNPFPGITGRICTRPCESVCRRGDLDEPIAIDYLKRFVCDKEWNDKILINNKITSTGKKIAIIGSGPAGLLCAYDLALKGYKPIIYEALPVVGGMLAVGIPEYRLPRDILNREINLIKQLGIKFKTNTCIGKDINFSDLIKKFDAVFIAVGSHIAHKLNIPGENLEGVIPATDFLRKVNLNENVSVGCKIAVIGGGDAAVDAARTALRLAQKQHKDNVEVFIVYRRSLEEMPAQKSEIQEAEKEGINFLFLATPVKIVGENGKVKQIICQKMKLGELDNSGRRQSIPIHGSEFVLNVDTVLLAIGQKPDLSFISKNNFLEISPGGTIKVDSLTLETNIPGVFAGGDAVSGPRTYIEAMAAGRKAAISIDRFLKNEDIRKNREGEGPLKDYVKADIKDVEHIQRIKIKTLSLEKRIGSFEEVEIGLTEKDVIKEAKRCLQCGGCSECMECVKVCESDAIVHNMQNEKITLNVGSVILSPGFVTFDPIIKPELGYNRFPNVITGLEFERILSASGPFKGHIVRPSDEKEPKRIAWIQCIGSRDPHINKGYCSSVCCMYAVKQAVIAKEHAPNIKPTIFYMDMRSFGKDFEKYIECAKKDYSVRFIRSRISSIQEDRSTHDLIIKYESEDGCLHSEYFNLVILSVGLNPPGDIVLLAKKFGIKLNCYNFASSCTFNPIETNVKGIYVAGAFLSPKDIPETVIQSSGAAALASNLLAKSRGEYVTEKKYPPEKDIRFKPPRVGVFICNCGSNIAGFLNVPLVTKYAKTLPNVIYSEENMFTCSQDTQMHIKEIIEKYDINRVVVASCTPRTHEPLFQDTIREAGLNPYLFEMANIRDQCSWVHMDEPEKATEKAKQLVKMAVAKVVELKPLSIVKLKVNQRAMVIGGGISGLISALGLADQGFEVFLVEKEKELGGNLRRLFYTLYDENIQKYLQNLIKRVKRNNKIHVFTKAEIEEVKGYIGNFKTTIKNSHSRIEFEHGVIIVATGAEEYKPSEYLYKKDNRVITQLELEEKIVNKKLNINDNKNIVMIQCIGSRDENHFYCSRICCSQAIKNALKIKQINEKVNVYIIYRDIRTYGFKEEFYQKAREKGIIFLRYDPEKKPVLKKVGKKLLLTIHDLLLNEEIILNVDILVLSTGVTPSKSNEKLSQLLKIPLNEDKFFLEAHVKLRPVDFATEGIFLTGLAHSPKFIDESISQAYAAVSRACTILSKNQIELPGLVAEVNQQRCTGCGICVEVCNYKAIELVTKKINGKEKIIAQVNEALCKSCGACVSACYSGAIQHLGFTDHQILKMIKTIAT